MQKTFPAWLISSFARARATEIAVDCICRGPGFFSHPVSHCRRLLRFGSLDVSGIPAHGPKDPRCPKKTEITQTFAQIQITTAERCRAKSESSRNDGSVGASSHVSGRRANDKGAAHRQLRNEAAPSRVVQLRPVVQLWHPRTDAHTDAQTHARTHARTHVSVGSAIPRMAAGKRTGIDRSSPSQTKPARQPVRYARMPAEFAAETAPSPPPTLASTVGGRVVPPAPPPTGRQALRLQRHRVGLGRFGRSEPTLRSQPSRGIISIIM